MTLDYEKPPFELDDEKYKTICDFLDRDDRSFIKGFRYAIEFINNSELKEQLTRIICWWMFERLMQDISDLTNGINPVIKKIRDETTGLSLRIGEYEHDEIQQQEDND